MKVQKTSKSGDIDFDKEYNWEFYEESRHHFNDLPTVELERERDKVVGQIVVEGSDISSYVNSICMTENIFPA